ncbi:unnamed protein product [Closterium sp. NIES-65]|nr:unnamed protein product [Closterium sp. NIES-65]
MRLGQLIAFQLYWNLIQSGYQSIMSVLMSLTKASSTAQRVLSLIDSLPDIDPDAGTKLTKASGAAQRVLSLIDSLPDINPDKGTKVCGDRNSSGCLECGGPVGVSEHHVGVSFHVDPGQVLAMVGHSGVSLHVDPGQVLTLVGRSGGGKSTVVHLLMRFYDPVPRSVLSPLLLPFRRVSLHVDPGQVLALVGRNGGGKSTVVHLLMRFYDPVQGRIVMDGRDLRELNLRSVHAHMGLVAQDTQMWACSIEENIAYGLPSYTRAEVEEAAKDALAYSGAVSINSWLDLGASVLILWWVGSAVVCWGYVGGMWVGRTDALAYSGAVSINSWLDLGASVLILWWVGSAVVCWGYVGGMWVGRTYGGVLVTEGHMRLDQLIAFQLCWNLIQYGGVLVMEGHMRLDQLIAFQLYWNLIQSGYGGVLVMEGHMRLGQLIAFQLYWNLIQSGYQSIMSVLMSLTKASGAAQRVLSLIDSLPDIDPDAGTKVSTLQGSIRMEDVHFHYQMRPDHPVLKGVLATFLGVSFHVDPGQVLAMVGHSGVSLHVDPGQVLALVGRSGGGKSTVVHLLMRFYDPVQGRIVMDGRDLRELNLRSVHAHMGLVAQDTQMWACSIEENIAYGLPSYTRAEVEEAAKHANAHDFITKFPEGYATRVGERGVRLSGGQRQRIAIARMLLRRPRVLLLDEATSALDAESEALVQGALDRLIAEGGRTIVLVAHRLSTVRNADSICVLEGGRVAEHGTHEQLLEIRECRWVVEGRDELLFLVECVYSK